MKVVFERDGQKTEVTGWRKWLITAFAIVVLSLVVSLAVIFLFGLALTVGVMLLVAVPAFVVLTLIARVLMTRGPPAG